MTMKNKTVAFNKRLKGFMDTLQGRVVNYAGIINESRLAGDTENVEQYLEEVKNLKKMMFKSEMLRHRLLFLKRQNPQAFTNDIIVERLTSYLGEEEIDLLETLDVFTSKFMSKVREELYIKKQNATISESPVVATEEVAVSLEETIVGTPNYILESEDSSDMVQLTFDLFA